MLNIGFKAYIDFLASKKSIYSELLFNLRSTISKTQVSYPQLDADMNALLAANRYNLL